MRRGSRRHAAPAFGLAFRLAFVLVASGCSPSPSSAPIASAGTASPPALPTIEPVLGLTWGLVEDVERPEEAFTIPSDLPTAPTGPDTPGHPGHFPGQAILRDVTLLGDRLVAVGYSATADGTWTARAWSSTDGLHWALSTIDDRPGSFAEAVTVNAASILVAVGRVGSKPAAWTSGDGARWSPSTVERLGVGAVRAGEPERITVIWSRGRELLAGGSAGPELLGRRARLWRSETGEIWEPVEDSKAFEGAEVAAIATGPRNELVALGRLGDGQRGTGTIAWRSSDGEHWERVDDPALAGGLGVAITVARDGAGLISVGSDLDEREAVAWSSDDGTTWTRAPQEESRLHFGEKIRMTDVLTTPAGYVGIGNFVGVQYGTGTSWLSTDGLTWTKAPLQPALGQGEPEALIAWGDRLVAVGSRGAPDNYIPTVWIGPALP